MIMIRYNYLINVNDSTGNDSYAKGTSENVYTFGLRGFKDCAGTWTADETVFGQLLDALKQISNYRVENRTQIDNKTRKKTEIVKHQ